MIYKMRMGDQSEINLVLLGFLFQRAFKLNKKFIGQKWCHKYFNGYHQAPLLGAPDAENLGFITFNSDGKDPEPPSPKMNGKTSESTKTLKQVSTPTKKQKTSASTKCKESSFSRNPLTESRQQKAYPIDVEKVEKEVLKNAPTSMEETQTAKQKMFIPEKIRDKLNAEGVSDQEEPTNMSPEWGKKLKKLVDDFKGLVFDRIA